MRKIVYLIALFCTSFFYAQTSGITYQAVIYYPNGQNIPGVDIQKSPMANKSVCLQFSLTDDQSQLEYQEVIQTITDEFGMVNLIIGSGNQTGGYASSFNAIVWNANIKKLKVQLDVNGTCQQFIVLSDNPLSAVPFAYAAVTANNVSGVVQIQNGGTGATNLVDAKINLQIDNVDNTSDSNKPISIATQAALDTKENTANKSNTTTLGTSDVLFPTQNAVKTYVDTNITTVNTSNTTLQATVTANATAATTAIAAVQADVDANETATNNALALKENTANKSNTTTLGTSDVLFPTQNAVKSYVDTNITTINASNTALQATVTANATAATTAIAAVQADVDANETATNNALALKENTTNKSTTTTLGTSDVLFPTQNAVKTYVDTNITSVNASNTALQATVTSNATAASTAIAAVQADIDTNETATNNALALKENTANKSTTTTLGTSDVLFPTQNAVKTYVDAQVASATIADADATTKGKIKLAGDLGGTADLPSVPGLVNKENTANKSTITTLGTSDVLFPTQNAVKTYVDTNITSVNASNTALQATVTSNATAASTAIAAVQADVDANETATNNALALKENTANKSTTTTLGTSDVLFPTQNAVKTYVDAQVASATIADADATTKGKIKLAGDLGGTADLPSVPGLVNKENTANKSTITTLGTSDVLFPTQNAVKTYVDTNITSVNASNTALQATVTSNATAASTAIAAVQADVDANETATNNALALKENTANKSTTTTLGTSDVLFPTQNAVKTYVDTNITSVNASNTALQATVTSNATAASTAIAAVQADIDTNETATNNALALKENTANKSTTTTLGTSDVLFPTQNAVKTYVDAQVASATIADADATTKGKIKLAGDLGGTADLPSVPGLVNKENTANKSTITTLGTSDVLFPTQNAVKTYVDAQVASATIADADAVTKGKIQLAGDLSGTAAAPTVPGLLNKENSANKSTTTTLGTSDVLFPTQNAVKTYVDTNINTVNANNTALQATVTANANAATTAIATVQADVDANETAVNTALALKENSANKSTTTTLGTSDVLFPTQNAVKTYVDAQVASATIADADAVTKGKIQLAGDLSGTAAAPTVPGLLNKENSANKSTTTTLGTSDVLFPTQNAVKTYVDTNITIVNTNITTLQGTVTANANAATTSIATVQADVDANETAANTALALKENSTNKTLDLTTVDGTSDIKFPSAKATKDYVDSQIASGVVDATTTVKGKVQLAGDLTGTAALPEVAVGVITTAKLADDAVTTVKITNGNVTTAKLANDAVETAKIKNANVTNAKLDKANIPLSGFGAATADVDLGSNKLTNVTDPASAQDAATKNYVDTATSSITTLTDGKIYVGNASNAATQVTPTGDVTITNAGVTAIGTGKVVTAMLATDAVETAKIKDANVTTAKLANDAVETAKIKNANVTNAKLDKANIPLSGFGAATADVDLGSNKLTNVIDPATDQDAATKKYVDTAIASITELDAANIYVGNGSNMATPVTLSGDVTMVTGGITTITDDAVTTAKIKNGEIINEDISATAAIVDSKLATIATAGKVSNSATTATELNTASSIVARDANGDFSAGTITAELHGNAATVTTNADLTGDVTSTGNATTVEKINGTSLAGLATGILKNTTGTGVPSIAVAADFPTLNQNTTGTATTATNLAGGAAGSIPYQTAAATTAMLPKGTDGQVLTLDNGLPSWASSAGITTMAAIGSTPNANGATISGSTLNLEPANGTNGGVVSTAAQTFAGAKTFTSVINVSPSAASSGDGASSVIKGQDATGSLKKGGSVTLIAGSSPSGVDGGDINITGGAGGNNMNGGDILLTPGAGATKGIVKVVGSDLFVNDDYFRVGKGKGNVSSNAAIGYQALNSNTIGASNIAIGQLSLYTNTTGSSNTSIGNGAMQDNISGSNNTVLGNSALYKNTDGASNTALGSQALKANISGSYNIAIGDLALSSYSTISNYNVAIGTSALRFSSAGNNTAIGYAAGGNMGWTGSAAVTGGANNVFLGYQAGKSSGTSGLNSTGFNSVMIGYDVRPAANGENNEIVIAGYNGTAGTVGKGSNTTSIGNSATTDTYIYGNLNVTGQIKLNNAVLSKSDTYAFLTTDNANLLVYTGTTAGKTITLPVASTNTGREITIKNIGTVSLTIASAGGTLISDSTTTAATSVAIGIEPSNNWIKAISDGTNWIILRGLF